MQNTRKTAPKKPAIKVLVHPFFSTSFFSKAADGALLEIWKNEIDSAASRGESFVLVGLGAEADKKLANYGQKTLGNRFHLKTNYSWLKDVLGGANPEKTRIRVMGEYTFGCVARQLEILAESGVPKKNLQLLAHKSVSTLFDSSPAFDKTSVSALDWKTITENKDVVKKVLEYGFLENYRKAVRKVFQEGKNGQTPKIIWQKIGIANKIIAMRKITKRYRKWQQGKLKQLVTLD